MAYSTRFREKMVQKMLGPDGRSATSLAAQAGVSPSTLSRWLEEAKLASMTPKKKPSSGSSATKRWTPAEKLRVVREAMALDEASLGALLRREGLHQADLDRFRQEVLAAADEGFSARGKRSGPNPEQKRLKQLEKELARKDKALAEAAALLVLRKKAETLFPSEEEGENTSGSDD
jgi:transposase-like protein